MKTFPFTLFRPAPAGTTLKTGLISCWEFDETSGTTAYDAHASNNLTHGGNVQVNQAGKIGKAININNDVSSLASASAFAGLTKCTVAAWLYFTGNLGSSVYYVYYSKQFTSHVVPAYQFQCSIFGGANDEYTLQVGNATTAQTQASGISTALSNQWAHIIMEWDTVSGAMNIYINNVLSVRTANTLTGTMGNANTPLKIGDDNDLFANFIPWVGYIDQTVVWNKILSSDERAALYNSGSGLAYANW